MKDWDEILERATTKVAAFADKMEEKFVQFGDSLDKKITDANIKSKITNFFATKFSKKATTATPEEGAS